MNKLGLWLCAMLLIAANVRASISLANVFASQREGTKLVDIYYDAFNSEASTLSVSVTVSNVSASTFTGDIGNSVAEGTSRHIVWDGGADLNGVLISNLTVFLNVSDAISAGMVRIPAGTNSGTDPDFGSYSLTVDAFLMDTTEVTREEWIAVADLAGDVSSASGASKAVNHPVQDITWYEAVRWCNARSSQEGLNSCYNVGNWSCDFSANGYRLPTDTEWGYAARGGMQSQRFPWGNYIGHDDANYYSSQADDYDVSDTEEYHPDYWGGVLPYTSPVGSFEPNAYGLYDMSGNIWEWCWNTIGIGKSRRGGSWASEAFFLQSGYIDNPTNVESPNADNYYVGFRTVRNATAPETEAVTFVFDSRDYQLSVASAHGSPVPEVGTSTFAWKSAVTCSVEAVVTEGGTNYTCTGWSGTGGVPVTGRSNSFTVVLIDLASSIIWNWATDDTDSDGMDDDWETAFFGDLGQAATNDYDFDGQDNLAEYVAGTIPTNSDSLFQIVEPGFVPGIGFVLHWPTASNRIYNVHWTGNLVYTDFQPLETNMAFPCSSATDTTHNAQSSGYYRIDVRRQ